MSSSLGAPLSLPAIDAVTYRLSGDAWRASPISAIREGLNEVVWVRIRRGDSVQERQLPALELLERVAKRELNSLLEALDVEPPEGGAAAALECAITDRKYALAADDRLRQASFLAERTRRLEASLESDELLLRSLSAGREARRGATAARARACAFEGLAETRRETRTPTLRRRACMAALEAAVDAGAWGVLASDDDDGVPRDFLLARERATATLDRALAEAIAWCLHDQAKPSDSEAQPPEAPPEAEGLFDYIEQLFAGLVGRLAKHVDKADAVQREERERDEAAESELRERLIGAILEDSGETAQLAPFFLRAASSPAQRDMPARLAHQPPDRRRRARPSMAKVDARLVADALVAMRVSQRVGLGPRDARTDAWCALCGSEYRLGLGEASREVKCGCCASKLVPHFGVAPRFSPVDPPRAARCPNCGDALMLTSTAPHVCCGSCHTAVTPWR